MFKRIITCLLISIAVTANSAVSVVPAAPAINAKSYILLDYESGKIIAEKNSHEILPPASLTKIMTIYAVAHELQQGAISEDDLVLVSNKAWKMPGSRMFIEVNKQVSVDDLLKGVIVQSGNDASVALAEYVSGTEEVFAQVMNQYAQQLGMENSHFENSTGLPGENHKTTAHDLAILASALIKDFPELHELHSIKEFTFNNITQPNRNQLLWRDPTVDGLKTGHTEEAGYCLVASAVRDGMRLISVVMGTDSTEARTKATQSLLNYGYRFFETKQLYSQQEKIEAVKVWKGNTPELSLGLDKPLVLTYPKGQFQKLKATVETQDKIIAPVSQGQKLGTLIISLEGDELARVPLLAMNAVEPAGIFNRIKDSIYLMME